MNLYSSFKDKTLSHWLHGPYSNRNQVANSLGSYRRSKPVVFEQVHVAIDIGSCKDKTLSGS